MDIKLTRKEWIQIYDHLKRDYGYHEGGTWGNGDELANEKEFRGFLNTIVKIKEFLDRQN
jgi:hypothetical protein